MSSDGRYMATSVGAVLYMSSDYGRTWDKAYTFPTSLAGSNNRDALGMSADGRYMAVVLYQDHIHVSSDYGKTWKKQRTQAVIGAAVPSKSAVTAGIWQLVWGSVVYV